MEPKYIPSTKTSAQRKCRPTEAFSSAPDAETWCSNNCQRGHCPPSHCICPDSNQTPSEEPCYPTREFSVIPGALGWCQNNCRRGNCPPSKCQCGEKRKVLLCRPISPFVGGDATKTSEWCANRCANTQCPQDCNCMEINQPNLIINNSNPNLLLLKQPPLKDQYGDAP